MNAMKIDELKELPLNQIINKIGCLPKGDLLKAIKELPEEKLIKVLGKLPEDASSKVTDHFCLPELEDHIYNNGSNKSNPNSYKSG